MNDPDRPSQLEGAFPHTEVPSQADQTQVPVAEQGSSQHGLPPQTTTCRHPLGRAQCPSHSNTRVGSLPEPGTDVHGADLSQPGPSNLPVDAPSTSVRPERPVLHSPALDAYIQNPLRHEQLNFGNSADHVGSDNSLPCPTGGSHGRPMRREPSQEHEDTRGVGSWCDSSS